MSSLVIQSYSEGGNAVLQLNVSEARFVLDVPAPVTVPALTFRVTSLPSVAGVIRRRYPLNSSYWNPHSGALTVALVTSKSATSRPVTFVVEASDWM